MLHVTNGDCAADLIRSLGLDGDVLPWRDVLHEGPVPEPATLDSLRPLRARFLASGLRRADHDGEAAASPVDVARELEMRDRRFGEAARTGGVALWFEHDLYDQLQLAQILDALAFLADRQASGAGGARTGGAGAPQASPARAVLVQSSEYLGMMDAEGLRALWTRRVDVTDAQVAAARRAWGAFAHSDPRAIESVLDEVGELPYMRAALRRHLEEFPSVENGLSRTERQILETLVIGSWTYDDLFRAAHHDREDPYFLGDRVFFDRLETLAGRAEIVAPPRRETGAPGHEAAAGNALAEETAALGDPLVAIENRRAWLTDAGREVLAGRRDRVETLGIDRWLGGVHLRGRRVPFRWDARAGRIVAT